MLLSNAAGIDLGCFDSLQNLSAVSIGTKTETRAMGKIGSRGLTNGSIHGLKNAQRHWEMEMVPWGGLLYCTQSLNAFPRN